MKCLIWIDRLVCVQSQGCKYYENTNMILHQEPACDFSIAHLFFIYNSESMFSMKAMVLLIHYKDIWNKLFFSSI